MNKTVGNIKRNKVALKNKAIKRRNIQKAISLVFYAGTCITCIGLFFSIIYKGNLAPIDMTSITTRLFVLGVLGSLTFGKTVLVATKRNS